MSSSTTVRRRFFGGLGAFSHLTNTAAQAVLWLAAGTQRHADFDEMSKRAWRKHNDGERAMSGLFASEREAYDKFVKPGDHVLAVGCGAGRDVLALLEAGHEVVGVEPSPEPATRLRHVLARHKAGHSVQVIEGFIENVSLTGTFDVIIFWRLTYSYIRQSSRRIEVLRRLQPHLTRGGCIIITYVPSPAGRRSRAMPLARLTAWLTRSDWTPEPNDVIQREEDQEGSWIHYEHWFTAEEIEDEAREAGLRVLAHWSPEGSPTVVLGI